jgi:hypothetical protein
MCGKIHYYRYCVNSLFAYVIGTFIYVIMPTTCSPAEFMKCNTVDGLGHDYSTGAYSDPATGIL